LWVGLGQVFKGSIIAFMSIDPTSMGQFRYETSSLENELLRLLLHKRMDILRIGRCDESPAN